MLSYISRTDRTESKLPVWVFMDRPTTPAGAPIAATLNHMDGWLRGREG